MHDFRDVTAGDSVAEPLSKSALDLVCSLFVGCLFIYVLLAYYIHCILLLSIFWILLMCWLLDLLFAGWVGCYNEVRGPLPRPMTHRLEWIVILTLVAPET